MNSKQPMADEGFALMNSVSFTISDLWSAVGLTPLWIGSSSANESTLTRNRHVFDLRAIEDVGFRLANLIQSGVKPRALHEIVTEKFTSSANSSATFNQKEY